MLLKTGHSYSIILMDFIFLTNEELVFDPWRLPGNVPVYGPFIKYTGNF